MRLTGILWLCGALEWRARTRQLVRRAASLALLLALPLTASSLAALEFELKDLSLNHGQGAADFVVEIEGPQQKLTIKGVETLAGKISAALGTLDADF